MKNLEAKAPQPWQMVYDDQTPPGRVRGLWRRGENLYARMAANNGKGYYYPLHVDKVPEALAATQVLKKLQRKGKLLPASQVDMAKVFTPLADLVAADAAVEMSRLKDNRSVGYLMWIAANPEDPKVFEVF